MVEKVKRDGPMWASAVADGGCSWNDTDTSHDILCPLQPPLRDVSCCRLVCLPALRLRGWSCSVGSRLAI